MLLVRLKPFFRKGREQIGILFERENAIENAIRKIRGIKWSHTHACWYAGYGEACYREIKTALKGIAELDVEELRKYNVRRKKLLKIAVSRSRDAMPADPSSAAWTISDENVDALIKMVDRLKLKAYSPSTIRTYSGEFLQLLSVLKERPVCELDQQEVMQYLNWLVRSQHLKENTLHSRINALKFYFEQVLGREKFFFEIPRPKKPKPLPAFFSQSDIAAIINGTRNKKHKAMLMLAYGAGLRVSEVVKLRTFDIDSSRMSIWVRCAKGKKDRLVVLSPVLLVMLRKYVKIYRPSRDGYLFEGAERGTPYSTRSLQEVLQQAKARAGVLKPGGVHSLRHSFATHLVERGTDVTMIQKLLGHNDIRTTMIYLHTSNKDLLKVVSPLDDLPLR